MFFNSQRTSKFAVPKQEDVGRVHSGSCFLAMLGIGDSSVSDVSFYSYLHFMHGGKQRDFTLILSVNSAV